MKRRMLLLALILAVPSIGFGVSMGLLARQNSEFRTELMKQVPEATPEAVAKLSLDDLCTPPRKGLENICGGTWRALQTVKVASIWSALAGIGILAAILLAGLASRASRTLLLLLFRPGLYLTLLALVGLVAAHGGIVMAVIYFGESALINRIHTGVIAVVGIGVLVAVAALAKGAFSVVHKARTAVVGRSITREQAPRLWAHVEETATRLGALKPTAIVVGMDANFFVTEAEIATLDGLLTGRTLYCSLPLCRILTTGEFSAVLGHELGHFKGKDTKFSQHFYPVYRGTATALDSLRSTDLDGAGALPTLPALAILWHFMECFEFAERKISRNREFAADACGASVSSPAKMAVALAKLHAFAGIWAAFDDAAAEAMERGKMFVNASILFARSAARNAERELLLGVQENRLVHPTDSHPPLSARLNALGIRLEQIEDDSLAVEPKDAASHLVDEVEKVEEEMTDIYQLWIARRGGIDLEGASESAEANAATNDPET